MTRVSTLQHGRGRLTVAILVQVVSVAFQTYAVLTAMPAAAAELGGLSLYAWGFTAFTVAMLFATVVAGRLCDRVGTRPPITMGVAIFALGLTLAGYAPTMLWLLATRALQGFGAGAMTVALMVLLAEVFTEAERPRVMTAFSFCWVIPSFFGPPLAAWIVARFGWEWVFWSTLIPIIAAVALGLQPLLALKRPDTSSTTGRPMAQIWAAALTAAGVATLQFAGQRLETDAGSALPNPMVTGLIAIGAVLMLAIGVPRLMPAGFVRFGRGLPAVVTERACQAGAFFAAESFLPLLLVTIHGFTLIEAGVVLTVGSVGWTLGSWLQSRPWFPLARDKIVVLGAALGILGAATLVVGAAWVSASWLWIAIGNAIGGLGMGLSIASTSLVVFRLSEPDRVGMNSASLIVAEALGNSLTTAAAGTVFVMLLGADSHLQFASLLGVSVVIAVAALGSAMRIGHVPNELHPEPSPRD